MIDKTVDLFRFGKIQTGMFVRHRFGKISFLIFLQKLTSPAHR
jgi:hypothetical protein